MSKLPTHVLVKTTSPRGYFGRAGLRFTRDWRPLRLTKPGEAANLELGIITPDILERLEAEKEMLAVKPATPTEVEEYEKAQAAGPKDLEAENAELKGKLADLEARLMKLEVGGNRGNRGGGGAADQR